MCYSNIAECSSRCVDDDTNRVAVTLGFPCIYDYPPHRGASRSFPGRPPLPARRVVHRRPFFRRQIVGLLCGKGVERPRGRGMPSGARESHVFCGCITINGFQRSIYFEVYVTTTTTTTEEHYMIRISHIVLVLTC